MPKKRTENNPYNKEMSVKMAERLRGLRESVGKTREEVVNELSDCNGDYQISISLDSIRKYECTNTDSSMMYSNDGMKVGYLRAFSDYYGVSADYLLGTEEYKIKRNDISVSELGLWEKSASKLIALAQDKEGSAKWLNLLLISGYTEKIAELMKKHYMATIVGFVVDACKRMGQIGTQSEQEFLSIAEEVAGHKAFLFLSQEEKGELYNMFCCVCDNLGDNPIAEIMNTFGGSTGLKGMYEARGNQVVYNLLRWASMLASQEYLNNEQKRVEDTYDKLKIK